MHHDSEIDLINTLAKQKNSFLFVVATKQKMSPSEYYVREATSNDLKFAQQATDVINAAYNTHGTIILTWLSNGLLKNLFIVIRYRWLDHRS